MLRRYLQKAFVALSCVAVLSFCVVFAKSLHDETWEADRILAIHELIQCGIAKMSTRAKEQVALAEQQRRIARLTQDRHGMIAAEMTTAPIFAALVDACAPSDQEQRREGIGWFKYALEHDKEYRAIAAPLQAQYQRMLESRRGTEAPVSHEMPAQGAQEMAWVFKT